MVFTFFKILQIDYQDISKASNFHTSNLRCTTGPTVIRDGVKYFPINATHKQEIFDNLMEHFATREPMVC